MQSTVRSVSPPLSPRVLQSAAARAPAREMTSPPLVRDVSVSSREQAAAQAQQEAHILQKASVPEQLNALNLALPLHAKLEFLQKIDRKAPNARAEWRTLFFGRTSPASKQLAEKIHKLCVDFRSANFTFKDSGYNKKTVENMGFEINECWQALITYMHDNSNALSSDGKTPRALYTLIQEECLKLFKPESFEFIGPAHDKSIKGLVVTSNPYMGSALFVRSSLRKKKSFFEIYTAINQLEHHKNMPVLHLKNLVTKILNEYGEQKQESFAPTKTSNNTKKFIKNLKDFDELTGSQVEEIHNERNAVECIENIKKFLLLRDDNGNFLNNGRRLFNLICENTRAAELPA